MGSGWIQNTELWAQQGKCDGNMVRTFFQFFHFTRTLATPCRSIFGQRFAIASASPNRGWKLHV
jgi:hypothetical protein